MSSQTVRDKKIAELIASITRFAVEIKFRGREDTKVFACVLDNRRISPPRYGSDRHATWLRTTYGSAEIRANKLTGFLKRYLPELYEHGYTAVLESVESHRGLLPVIPIKIYPTTRTGNVMGWTVRADQNGKYRAFKKVDGKTKCIYIGKSNNLEIARAKIKAWTEQHGGEL